MVKNFGGNKSKKQGRKHLQEAAISALAKTRLKDEDLSNEIYVAVTKMLGGSLCEVIDNEMMMYHCVIRSKFRGRHKRDNMIVAGSWLLVGLRSWQTLHAPETGHGKPKCDLLEVYNSSRDMAYIVEHHSWLVGRLPLVENACGTADSSDMIFEQELEDEARRARSAALGSYMDEICMPDREKSNEDTDMFDFDNI